MPKIAIILTVKNEERLLRNNLLYHKAIGVSHAYVYFDGATDNGKQSILDLDFVTVSDSLDGTIYSDRTYLKKFTSQSKEHHTARQCLHTYDALQKCKKAGIDWVISIDADELVCSELNAPSDLQNFFSAISKDIDVVYLQTKEVVARKSRYLNVFKEETWFKTQPTFKNRFENIYKKIRNPFSTKNEKHSYWLGQHLGKGAIRVGRNIYPHNVHRYKKLGDTSIQTLKRGYILHYHIFDAEDFIKKFTNFSNRPDTFLSGNKVNSLKLLLREIVNQSGKTNEELNAYFRENLMFSEAEFKSLQQNIYLVVFKRSTSAVQEITSVKKVFDGKIETL